MFNIDFFKYSRSAAATAIERIRSTPSAGGARMAFAQAILGEAQAKIDQYQRRIDSFCSHRVIIPVTVALISLSLPGGIPASIASHLFLGGCCFAGMTLMTLGNLHLYMHLIERAIEPVLPIAQLPSLAAPLLPLPAVGNPDTAPAA